MNIDKFEVFESIIKVKKNLSFNLNDESFNIIGFNREILKNVLDICYSKGYDFDNKLLTLDQVNDKISKTTLEMKAFYKLPSGLYWQGLDSASNRDLLKTCKSLLEKVGKLDSLKILDDTKSTTIVDKDSKKYTFIEAAQLILKQNDNKPMTALEIWEEVNTQNLVETIGKTPKASMNAQLIVYSDNTTAIGKKKNSIFRIIEDRPYKFILLNPNGEVQPVPDDELAPEDKIQRFGPFSGIPTDFKAAQSQDEKEVLKPADRNPFGGESKESGDEFNSSALFVVGLSGSGKSTRILSLLRKNGHKIILIGAENAPSPNLLLDYDQNEGYIPSDISEFIISARKDPKHFYTIVFDECHEYIDEIKRSILHAISTKRGEKRFFGVRKSVRDFFESLETYETTSKVIPDNVGFIFISSKPDVFEYHADFMGRVDKVEVKREDPYPYPDLKYIQSKIDRQDQL
jgi:hypothetical protein